jgi:hypothetical protein
MRVKAIKISWFNTNTDPKGKSPEVVTCLCPEQNAKRDFILRELQSNPDTKVQIQGIVEP